MGVSLELWRCRIGYFVQPDKRKTYIRAIILSGTQVRTSIRILLALSVLLVMAGVEQNPGPPRRPHVRRSQLSQSSQSRLTINEEGGLGLAGGAQDNEESNSGQNFELYRTLQNMQDELKSLNRNFTRMNTKVDSVFSKLNEDHEQLRLDHEELNTQYSVLEKRCDYLESQSRRNNLVFHGFEENDNETWEDCETKIKTYMSSDLEIDPDNVEIERAHRLGRGTNRPRPIIAKFLNFKDKQRIQNRIKEKLTGNEEEWENPHRVSEDYTQGVRDQRKALTPYLRNARAADKRAYISFNKLVIDGKSFLYNQTSGELTAERKSDQAYAKRYTRLYGSAETTRGQAHGHVDITARERDVGRDDTVNRDQPLDNESNSDNLVRR